MWKEWREWGNDSDIERKKYTDSTREVGRVGRGKKVAIRELA